MRNRKIIQPDIIEEYKKRMYYDAERINEIHNMSVFYQPKGSFYLFVNIKKAGLSSEEVADRLLKEAHVLTLQETALAIVIKDT